jgi:hypothetical protein
MIKHQVEFHSFVAKYHLKECLFQILSVHAPIDVLFLFYDIMGKKNPALNNHNQVFVGTYVFISFSIRNGITGSFENSV